MKLVLLAIVAVAIIGSTTAEVCSGNKRRNCTPSTTPCPVCLCGTADNVFPLTIRGRNIRAVNNKRLAEGGPCPVCLECPPTPASTPAPESTAPPTTCAPCPCGVAPSQSTKRRTSNSCPVCNVCTTTTTEAPVEVCSGNKRRNCIPATTTTTAPTTTTTETPVEVCTGSKRRNCVPATTTVAPTTESPVEVTCPVCECGAATGKRRAGCPVCNVCTTTTTTTVAPSTTTTTTTAPTHNCWTCPAGYVHWFDIPNYPDTHDPCGCVPIETDAPTTTTTTAAPETTIEFTTTESPVEGTTEAPGVNQSGENQAKTASSGQALVASAALIFAVALFNAAF